MSNLQAASVHGCHFGSDGYTAAKDSGLNITFHTVAGDDYFKADVQDALKAAGAEVSVYDGMYHGFVTRGDFANNAKLKAAADKCMAAIVTQFAGA